MAFQPPAPLPEVPATETESQVIDIFKRLGGTEKQWYASKTLVFALLSALVGIAMIFGFTPDMAFSEQFVGIMVTAISAVFGFLRLVTKDPVG